MSSPIQISSGVHLYNLGERTHGPAFRFNTYISSALAYTDSEMKLNRILFLCLERKCGQCELWRVSDHYFNVCLGVSGREMKLTRTCCFEFTEEGSRQ